MLVANKARHNRFRVHPPAGTRRVTSGHPGLSLRTHFQPGMLVVQVYGPIEAGNAARLNDHITDLANPDRPLILDLRGVNFINDDGFHALVRIAEYSHRTGMRWALVTSEAVDRLLSGTSSTYRLPTAASVDEAMQRLTSHDPAWSLPHRVVTTARELTRC
ncbi:STAS domain-containing protein [Mycobacterium sp.]|jgi:anti-anti-sigma factor|uniref:STAS domain-containing protein n=1 Tax=Mycobacterium sp. TaxID=1785 RepID=UPI00262C9851|nr:STAS domain-containing protein [Mycobacterium sp.]